MRVAFLSKKHFISCLKICVAVVIVWYLFYSRRLTVESFSPLINLDNLPFLLLSGGAFTIAQMLAAYRLKILLETIEFPLPFFGVFKLTMIGSFFNIVIPGAVGGDIVKGTYLFRGEEDRRGRSSGIILMDRVIGFLALLIIGLISVIYLYFIKTRALLPYMSQLKWVFVISTTFLMIFSLFIFSGKNRQFRVKAKAIASKLLKKTVFYHMTDAIGALTKHWIILVKAFGISLGAQAIALTGLLFLVLLVPEKLPDIAALTAVSSVVLLFGIIPVTPGNIGWTELVASIGWSMVGSSIGGFIFFYWRIINIIFSLPGGFFYLLPGDEIIQRRSQ